MRKFSAILFVLAGACASEQEPGSDTYFKTTQALSSVQGGVTIKFFGDHFIPDSEFESSLPRQLLHIPDGSLSEPWKLPIEFASVDPGSNDSVNVLAAFGINGHDTALKAPIFLTFGMNDVKKIKTLSLNPESYYILYKARKDVDTSDRSNWIKLGNEKMTFDNPKYPIYLGEPEVDEFDRPVTIEMDDLAYVYFVVFEKWTRHDTLTFSGTAPSINLDFEFETNAPFWSEVWDFDSDFAASTCNTGLVLSQGKTWIKLSGQYPSLDEVNPAFAGQDLANYYCKQPIGDHSLTVSFQGNSPGSYSGNQISVQLAYHYLSYNIPNAIYLFEKVFNKTANTVIEIEEYGLPGKQVKGTITGTLTSADGTILTINSSFSMTRNH